jgi:RHS repeat-associated protein
MAYRTRLDTTRAYALTNLVDFAPIPIVPLWDARGQPDIGMFADFGAWDNCQSANGQQYCARIIWPGKYFAYDRPPGNPLYWHGTLIDDKKDAVGTHYRRNRYYDPKSGRFTQEDPIGLAGGLNLYGFANGDPVNFSDPFGLATCPPVCPFPILAGGGGLLAGGPLGWAAAGTLALMMLLPEPEPVSLSAAQISAPVAADATAVKSLPLGKRARAILAGIALGGSAILPGATDASDATETGAGGRSSPAAAEPKTTDRKPRGREKPPEKKDPDEP